MIDGKLRSLYRRRYCLDCSPFGTHNTSKVPVGSAEPAERERARRDRRNEQFRRYLNRRRRERKQELVASRAGRCMDCGYSTCLDALEFHHRDMTTKEFGLGNFNGTWARVLAEAEKCDLLCSNCHSIRHGWDKIPPSSRQVELRRAAKMRAIAMFGDGCEACAGTFPASVFQFHHWDADRKEFGFSNAGVYRRWEAMFAELIQCVMLCAKCHREVHAGIRTLSGDRFGTLGRSNADQPAVA
jgi:hypothetical protein